MPIYSIQGPDGKIYEIEGPAGATKAQVVAAIQAKMQAPEPAPAPALPPIEPPKREGFGAAFGKGLEGLISPSRTAIGAVTGSAEEAALAGLKRAEASPYADQVSLEKVKEAYQRGLLPAAGEVIRQIPLAITEQLPNIAATLGSARLGAMAGAPLGPYGAIGGGILGAVAPSLLQQFGGNIQRQAQEQLEAKQPVDISRTAAAAAALPQAGLDVAATFIPLGRTVAGSVLGPQVKQLLERGAKESAEQLARESLPKVLAKGAGISIATEAPTEAVQSMLERAQAGLPLLSDDALKEYGEAAYQASLIAPIGSAARVGERSTARQQTLPPELRPGETDRQAAERIQAEILQMKQAAQPPAPGPILSTNNLYNLMAQPNGYGLVEQYKQRLMAMPNQTPEVKQAIEDASFIQRRSVIEAAERRASKPAPQETVQPKGPDAGKAITPPSGEGVQVAGEPGAGVSTERPAAPVPGGVVSPVADVGQPSTGEGSKPAAVKPQVEALQGSETRLILPDGEKRSANWEVIEADSVSAAMSEGRAQPRDRQRAASNAQVQSIANNPDFDRLSDTSQTLDYGAPTLTGEYVIVGGNGRFEGINLSYDTEVGQTYKQNLISNAQRFGLDPAQVSEMKKPILIRKISGESVKPDDTRKLAIQSNIAPGLEMSDMERAALDSERLTNLQELDITDTGDIPLTTKNMGTIRDALKGYTKEELSGMLAADGSLSQGGLRRVKNAVLYKAYGKTDTLSRLLESPDADLKNVGTALMRASGSMSRLMDGIRSGAIPADYDIIADLTGAVETLSALRASGTKVQDFINQSDMFGDGISNEAKTILAFLDQNLRSAKSITEFLNDYANAAISAESAGDGLFGEVQLPSKQETIERAAQRPEAERAAAKAQQTIFEQPVGAPAEEGGAKPEGAERPPEGDEGAVAKLSLRLNEAIRSAKSDIEAQIKDWSSRVYKANKKQVELAGDGPSRQASMSVSQINESRRRRAVEGLQAELKAVRDLEKQIADPEMAERLLNKSKRLFKEAQERVASGEAQRKDAGLEFEATLLSELGIRPPRGAYESNNISKAIRRVVETMPDEPKVTEQEAKPYEPLTAQQEEDVLGLFAVARGEPKKSLVEMRKRYEASRAAPASVETKPEPTALDKEIEAKIEELGRVLSRILGRFGLKDVALNLVEDMKAEGEYAQSVIRLALDAASPVQALRHESIHALKELGFFTSQQWAALEKQAKSKWVDQYLKNVNINKEPLGEGEKSRYDAYMDLYKGDMDAIIEEAIADAFGDFDVNKAPPGLMQAILTRLRNFFDAVKTAFGGEITAEQVFRKVEKGELGKVTAAGSQSITKESLRVMRGEEVPNLGKKVTVDMVGKYFDDQFIKEFGGKLDYNNPQHFDRAVQQATEEVQYQIKNDKSGLDWYEEDIQKAFKDTAKILPELKNKESRILFSVIAGIMSPQTIARDNWFIAAKAFEHYVKTGDIPGNNPENGNLWMGGTQAPNKKVQLEFLDKMVKDLGQKNAIKWLMTPHPVKEINEFRSKYGNIKSGIDGKATDIKPGLYAFGPKIGPFVSNINGIHDVTVDKWFTRTFNRYFGTMIGPDGKIIDAPTEPQRRFIKELANKVAEDAGIKNYQVQSLLWFYEQRLFTELGAQSPSYGFSDGAVKFLESRGKGGGAGVAVPAGPTGAGRVKPAKPSLRAPQTEAFKKWSGGAPVIGLRQDHVFVSGKPVVVEALHGTTNADITEFKKSKANIESDFGAGFYASNTPADVAINYANVEGADLTRRIETLAERIADNEEFEGDMDAAMEEARKRLSQGAPNTMKLYMLFKNPAVLGGKGETFFDYNQSYNEETDEYGEPTGSLVDFVNQLDEIGEGIDISMRDVERAKQDLIDAARDNEGLKFSELAQIVKDRFSDTYDLEDGSAANGEVLRQALEGMGFDGVIDTSAYSKFGPRMIRGAYSMIKTEGMAGLDKDTVHFVAFKPTQIKSATGNIGTFDVTKPDIRYSLRDPIGLYSELENKVAQGPNKAPAASWKAYINGLTQKGVKPEEIEWSGVRDWLDLQTGPVTKDAVNAYLKQGGVKVEEVVLGESMPGRDLDRWLDRWADKNPGTATARAINQGLSWNEIAEVAKNDNQPLVRRLLESQETPAKYGDYTLPGGTNYREVLLTLPSKQERDFMWEWFDPRTQESRQFATRDAALLDKPIGAVVQKVQTAERNEDFKSSHWDQPNVLAHIRINDRTDADGNKVLFVEEIQSDWGQEGKKKGFVGDLIPQNTNWQAVDTFDTVRTRAEAEAKLEELQPFLERYREPGMENRLVIREGDGFFDIVEESRSPTATAPSRYGVPRGPFVTKTEGWLNLALKRIMVMAAEGGYDKVAFSDAEPHFKRWGTERIDWSKQPDGSFLVRAKSQEGGEAAGINLEAEAVARGLSKTNSKTVNSVKDLEDTIRPALTEGQKADDLAPKIWERMQAENAGTAMPRREGFEAFYGDKRGMNPKTGAPSFLLGSLKKLLPKVGGGQAETVAIESTKGNAGELKWFSRIAPGAARVIQRAPNVFQVLAKDERSGVEQVRGGNFNTREDAEQYIADNTAGITQDQTGFSVTPEMKQKVETTGLPRFSLRSTIPIATRQRIVQTTIARDEKTFYQRIIEAISPNSFQSFRADALNRYDQLSVYDKKLAQKMGGKALLASSSAESAALFSDLGAGLTASALGVHDRMGGVPVYRNGVTIISNKNGTVKGPTAIFAPLAKYNDPFAYQAYQFWAGVKRGSRFLADGREQLFEPADIQKAESLRKQFLKDGVDFNAIQKEWIKYNDGLVNYMVDTGVLSKERADIYKKHSDYLPFYRQMDGVETVGPKIFQSISGIKPPKKLKGGEAPIDDFLENIVRNTQSAIQAGIKNIAAQRAADVAMKIQMADRLDYHSTAPNVFHVYENGKPVSYVTQDQLFINAVKSLGLPDLPFIGMLSGPANLLRNLVTKDPGFMLANLMRDSMSAWVTSGVKMTPMVDTITNFGAAIAGKSPEFQALMNSGILGGYEFSQNVEQSGREFGKALRKQAKVKQPGMKGVLEMGAKPFTSLWEALEKGSTASDAATRMEVYKRTLAETGNEAEALYRALEVMNFNRKGSSAVVRVLTAAVPFLNARMQGLDVLYRASFGKMNAADAKEVQRRFFVRGATIMALSAAYWLLTHDDDEYKKQEQETRDNYWLLPSLGVKIPIPFEIGVLFKVIPERFLAYTFGSDTGEDFIKSMARQLTSTLAFNPIPQTALPVVEAMTNFSFFTMRPIVGQGLEGVQPAYQVGPGTSRLAEKIGAATKGLATELQISPMKLDQLINGYTGTMGMYMVNLMDAIFDMNTDSPKPSRRFEQMPLIRRFAIDPEARGSVTAYYELKNSVDAIVRTSNMLERTMNYEELPGYLQDNARMLASKDYILDLEKTMKEFREMKILIRSAKMSAEAKGDAIASIEKMENQLTANIQYLKSLAKGG